MQTLNFQKIVHKMYIGSLCGVAITMVLSLRINSLLIILAGVSAILCFLSHKNKIVFNKNVLFFMCLYLGSVIGVLNSTNMEMAYSDLEQKLSWLSLPIIFLIGGKVTKNEFILILKLFLISTCCVNAYALTTPESFINQPSMTWHEWNESLQIDRIYLGMYSVFGLVIAYYFFNLSTRPLEKIIYPIVFLFLVVSLVNTFAKTAMAIFLVLCLLEVGYLLYKRGKTLFYTGVGALIAITIVVFITNNSLRDVTEKILNKETFDFSNRPLLFESINFRYLTWESSWTVLKQDNNWIMGVGTGDTQKSLDDIYKLKLNEHERNYLAIGYYNSHNQYLSTWLDYGLAFFLLLMFHFFYSLNHYYRGGLRIGIYFIIIIMVSCLTESMFERQQGIVFYTFFQLLLFSRVEKE